MVVGLDFPGRTLLAFRWTMVLYSLHSAGIRFHHNGPSTDSEKWKDLRQRIYYLQVFRCPQTKSIEQRLRKGSGNSRRKSKLTTSNPQHEGKCGYHHCFEM